MSVAAMTMDERPLMNTYDKNMSTKYEQNLHIVGGGGGGSGVGSGGIVSGSMAPPSGPASPTPSVSGEDTTMPQTNSAATTMTHQYNSAHHHHHNHHHHHHAHPHNHTQHHHHHDQQQQQQPDDMQELQHQHEQQQQQQQKQQQLSPQHAAAAVVVAEAAVAAAEQRQRMLEDEIETLKLGQQRLAQQFCESQKREKILIRRLQNKEQDFQDFVCQIGEYKLQQMPSSIALRTALLDPAVNLLFEKLKRECKNIKCKLEETQNELAAWKFTPDSNTGKRLMAKCRLLYQENEELGKMTSNGRLAKLETELLMQKSFNAEVKKSQQDDFLQELDEDVEGMQSTIIFLQQEMKVTRDRICALEKINYRLEHGKDREDDDEDENESNDNPLSINGDDGRILSAPASPSPHSMLLNNEYKPTIKLETIAEHDECLGNNSNNNSCSSNTNSTTTTTPTVIAANNIANEPLDYAFNGNASNESQSQSSQPQQLQSNETPLMLHDDSNSNGSKNSARLTRKRNYEEDIGSDAYCHNNDMGTPLLQMNTTPRTLPPKKSKLRGITTRRSSQLEEIAEQQQQMSVIHAAATTATTAAVGSNVVGMVVDNAVAGMASEEINNSVVAMDVQEAQATDLSISSSNNNTNATTTTNTTAPARILTRRRSVRMQQQQQQNGNLAGGGTSGMEY